MPISRITNRFDQAFYLILDQNHSYKFWPETEENYNKVQTITWQLR